MINRNLPLNLSTIRKIDIDTVNIHGKIMMKKRIMKTVDENSIMDKALELGNQIDKRVGISIKPRWREI